MSIIKVTPAQPHGEGRRVLAAGRITIQPDGSSECYVRAVREGLVGTSYEFETPPPRALPIIQRLLYRRVGRRVSLTSAFRNVHRALRAQRETS